MSLRVGLAEFSTPEFQRTAEGISKEHAPTVLEWTIDQLDFRSPPLEQVNRLNTYSANDSLIGHGVHYSVLSATNQSMNDKWLAALKADPLLSRYARLSIHFGFSTGWKMRQGPPLPVPLNDATLDCGRRNLERVAKIAPCRIGLENLALAFSRRDVEDQGRFLDRLLEPFDGFVLLDLHNLYCQAVNFAIPFAKLIDFYPLARVEELHISGGSILEYEGRSIRRDTHDDRVPDELYEYMRKTIPLCPNLKYIILEQLPSALKTSEQQAGYIADFARLQEAVDGLD